MRALKTLAQCLAVLVVFSGNSTSAFLNCQNPAAGTKPVSVAVSIELKQESFRAGEKPWVILSEKNVSSQMIFEGNDFKYRIYVEGPAGPPHKTDYYRQILGEPGMPPLMGGGALPLDGTAPGKSIVKNFDLTAYYDLSVVGKYSVYLEVRDESGQWLRSNTVQFEILPPAS